MQKINKTVAIVLAGGEGKRFGMMKQFIPIHNVPIFIYTLKKFNNFPIILTIPPKFKDIVIHNIKCHNRKRSLEKVYVINGGKTRQESVYNALNFVWDNASLFNCKNVIITDANRPCISKETIDKCIRALKKNKAVATVCKSINTSCICKDNTLKEVLDRTFQYDLLLPQCFHFYEIYTAHQNVTGDKIYIDATDDVTVLNYCYPEIKCKVIPISFWEGLKLTYPEDYKIFELLLQEE